MRLTGYIICLVLTVILELAAWRFVLGRRENGVDICLMNLATNPAANVLMQTLLAAPLSLGDVPATVIVEALVIMAEWGMLNYMGAARPLRASIVLNFSSYAVGMAILYLFFPR